jgi:methylmalonyl-CoA carboxyltransferase large subunit
MKKNEIGEIRELLERIRGELTNLAARVDAMENGNASPQSAAPEPVPAEAVKAPVSDEIVAAISAVVAAYFGERVHIRQIRLIGSPAWAQQGRVSIQASHRLH